MKKLLTSHFSLLIAILIIAAFLRLYNITQLPPGLYPDEAMNGNNALEALSTGPPAGGFKVFYPENNGREGLFINIQAMFLKFLMPFNNDNPEPWMLRLASAIFGILTVLGLYFLAKELFKSEKIALLSSFFLATSFWHINFSRIGFRAIMAPFFAVWAFYFLLKALNSDKYKLASVIGGISLGLGFHSYIAFRAMPAAAIIAWVFYWFKNKDKVFRKKIIISAILFTVSALIMFAPLGIYFLKHPQDFFGRTTQVSVMSSPSPVKILGLNVLKTAGMFNFAGDWNWRHNYAGKPELFWPIGIMFATGLFLGIYYLFKKEERTPFVILFFWLVIAALPVVVSQEGIPHALRSILLIPPAFILAGFGGVRLYQWATKYGFFAKIRKPIVVIFLILLIAESYTAYFILWGKNYNTQGAFAADYAQIGRELRNLPKELPKYVIIEANGVDVRGIPMPAQTVMFLTDTFTPEKQKEKNLFYVLPKDTNKIPKNAYVVVLK